MDGFPIDPAVAVVTSTFVTLEGMAILEVSHQDDDGGSLWQFHCGNGDYGMEKMQLVRLDTILAIDPTVNQVAGLSKGQTARRNSIGSPWRLDT